MSICRGCLREYVGHSKDSTGDNCELCGTKNFKEIQMNKQQVIEQLEKIKESTLASDFGEAFAETPEEALEIAARETIQLSIDLLKASQNEPGLGES